MSTDECKTGPASLAAKKTAAPAAETLLDAAAVKELAPSMIDEATAYESTNMVLLWRMVLAAANMDLRLIAEAKTGTQELIESALRRRNLDAARELAMHGTPLWLVDKTPAEETLVKQVDRWLDEKPTSLKNVLPEKVRQYLDFFVHRCTMQSFAK